MLIDDWKYLDAQRANNNAESQTYVFHKGKPLVNI
jgi:hypothetical protein